MKYRTLSQKIKNLEKTLLNYLDHDRFSRYHIFEISDFVCERVRYFILYDI